MPAQHPNINRFNSGEWSQEVHGRTDLEDYDSACSLMTGYLPLKTGVARCMTGTEYLGTIHDNDYTARLIAFEFSTSDKFMLEFGHEYFRVWSTGASAALVTTSPAEIATAYQAADLYGLQFKPINDIVVITHKNYETKVLTRVSDTNWTLSDIPQDRPALLDLNDTDSRYLTCSATTGTGATLSSTGHTPFTSSHVGSYWVLKHERAGNSEKIDLSITTGTDTSASIRVQGTYSVVTNGFWWGVLKLQTSPDNSIWTDKRSWDSKSNYNLNQSFDTEGDDIYVRITFTSSGNPIGTAVGEPFNGTSAPSSTQKAGGSLITDPSIVDGIVQVTSYSSSSSVTVDVIKELAATTATNRWHEGAWSDAQGWPSSCEVFEQRLILGGTALQPTRIWMSESDNIGTFYSSTLEYSDPIDIKLAGDQDRIKWLIAGKRLLVGTGKREYAITSNNLESAITPTNIAAKIQSSNGCAELHALNLGDSVLFITRDTAQIKELTYSFAGEKYQDNDVSRLARHILSGGIVEWTYQQNPHRIIFMRDQTGIVIGLLFDKSDNIVAFFRREVDDGDTIESIQAIVGDGNEDELWFVVNRRGTRCIERQTVYTTTLDDICFMDSSVSVLALGGTVVTGLPSHLEGRTVQVWSDGSPESDKIVSSGSITLDYASSAKVTIGLPFPAEVELLPIEAPTGDGASRAKLKKCTHYVIGMIDSLMGSYGWRATDGDGFAEEDEWMHFPMDTNRKLGEPLSLKTQSVRLEVSNGSYRDIRPTFRRDSCAPWNISYLIPAVTTSGD